jgi:hypothetical protein
MTTSIKIYDKYLKDIYIYGLYIQDILNKTHPKLFRKTKTKLRGLINMDFITRPIEKHLNFEGQ